MIVVDCRHQQSYTIHNAAVCWNTTESQNIYIFKFIHHLQFECTAAQSPNGTTHHTHIWHLDAQRLITLRLILAFVCVCLHLFSVLFVRRSSCSSLQIDDAVAMNIVAGLTNFPSDTGMREGNERNCALIRFLQLNLYCWLALINRSSKMSMQMHVQNIRLEIPRQWRKRACIDWWMWFTSKPQCDEFSICFFSSSSLSRITYAFREMAANIHWKRISW